MKRLFWFALLTLLPLVSQAADTAYTALRVVGKKNGEDSLGRVLEVRGRSGSPEPVVWKVVLAEAGRAGVREYEVQHGRITAERSPSGPRGGGAPLDLNRLNVDSEGAFTIVNQEAQKAGMPFDRVDYFLSNSGRGSAPVWHLEVFDGRKGQVASMDIAADSGNVLNRDFQGGHRPAAQDDQEFLRAQNERARRGPGDEPPVYEDDRRPPDDRRRIREQDDLGPGILDIFGKISRHFDKRSRQLKSFFER